MRRYRSILQLRVEMFPVWSREQERKRLQEASAGTGLAEEFAERFARRLRQALRKARGAR